MSAFLRGDRGRSNEKLFYSNRIVVIVEGGNHNRNKAISNGPDLLFWQCVFNELQPGLKIKLKSVGSKEVALEEAKAIVDGTVKDRIVAIDSDYDELRKKKLIHNRVLYTYGYSIENDLWSKESILLSTATCYQRQDISIPEIKEIEDLIGIFDHPLRWLLRIDARLYHNTGYGFYDRKANLERLFSFNRRSPPKFNTTAFTTELRRTTKNISAQLTPLPYPSLDGARWIYGKLLLRLYIETINYWFRSRTKYRFNEENQWHIALLSFACVLRGESDIANYYKLILSNI